AIAQFGAGQSSIIQEGESLKLDASQSTASNANDALTYAWDINGDGLFTDVTGSTATPTLTWAQLAALVPPIVTYGPGYQVRLKITDPILNPTTTTAPLVFRAFNPPSTVTFGSSPNNAVVGQALTLNNFVINDSGFDTYTGYTIHWGDGQNTPGV